MAALPGGGLRAVERALVPVQRFGGDVKGFGQFFGIAQEIPTGGEFFPLLRAKRGTLQLRDRLSQAERKPLFFLFVEVEPFPLLPQDSRSSRRVQSVR